jgi:plasmid stabilization system protein ParE
MKFDIDIHPRAVSDLEEIVSYIGAYSSDAADRTYLLIKHGIVSLSDFPRRCAKAPESSRTSLELRHLIIGNYRVLYSIIGNKVHVWRIVHAAQTINPAELF